MDFWVGALTGFVCGFGFTVTLFTAIEAMIDRHERRGGSR